MVHQHLTDATVESSQSSSAKSYNKVYPSHGTAKEGKLHTLHSSIVKQLLGNTMLVVIHKASTVNLGKEEANFTMNVVLQSNNKYKLLRFITSDVIYKPETLSGHVVRFLADAIRELHSWERNSKNVVGMLLEIRYIGQNS